MSDIVAPICEYCGTGIALEHGTVCARCNRLCCSVHTASWFEGEKICVQCATARNSKPFAHLEYKYRERRLRLTPLFHDLLTQGLVMVVVRRVTSIFDAIRYRRFFIAKGPRCRLYAISSMSEMEHGLDMLIGMRLWHLSRFHLLIGNAKIVEDLKRECSIFPQKDIHKIQSSIKSIVGEIDPLDDVLICYGKDQFRRAVANAERK